MVSIYVSGGLPTAKDATAAISKYKHRRVPCVWLHWTQSATTTVNTEILSTYMMPPRLRSHTVRTATVVIMI